MRTLGLISILLASSGCQTTAGETGFGAVEDDGAQAGAVTTNSAGKWTMLVYAATDDQNRDLVRAFGSDAEEWARMVGGSKLFRLVVQRDYSAHDDGNPASERYVLERGQKLHPETLEPGVMTLGETDTTRPGTLREFLEDGIRRFPAQKYWVVVTGHGDNWLGAATDASAAAGQRLPLADLRADIEAATRGALSEVRQQVEGSDRIDVIQFDACRMGSIEVATELRAVADFMVASQENEPNAGHPYGAFYSLAQLHLGSSPRTAVSEVVSDYVRSYNPMLSTRAGTYVGTGITSVAVNLRQLDALIEDLRTLVESVRAMTDGGLDCQEIEDHRQAASALAGTAEGRGSVAGASALDLGSLLDLIADGGPPGSADLGSEVTEAARAALETIGHPDERHDPNRRYGFVRSVGFPADGPIVTEGHSLGQNDGLRPSGLSVLFGDYEPLLSAATGARPIAAYRATAFETATGWTGLTGACEAKRQACLDWTGSPFDPNNPCLD